MSKNRMISGFVLFCTMFLLVQLPSQAAGRVQPTDDTIVIVIDPGHGGENLGTIENGYEEKSMTMVTAQAMYDELCLYDDIEVYMTHTEDVNLSLKERASFAAEVEADFLFSIHYNASVNHDRFGSEVWISSKAPYNAYGYQFGYEYLKEMQRKGLYLRGIKTRLLDNRKEDYYGIIRESVALSVPAVILEHCHVDEERDEIFCDNEDKLIAFGQADATAVARYFGLKSTVLGVDYSTDNALTEVEGEHVVKASVTDESAPDICVIEVGDTEEDTGTIVLNVTAADYDSPLIYYDYSYDGGKTYCSLQKWPGSNPLNGTYQDTIQISFTVPSGTQPDIIFRAHNMYDLVTESNRITMLRTFLYHDEEAEETDSSKADTVASAAADAADTLPGTDTFRPAVGEEVITVDDGVSFLDFLKLCLALVSGMFVLLLFSRLIVAHNRRKRRRQRRKDSGNKRNHPR